ncbi:HK97-gp10 family putative phage morphogenesis protein [Melissococcus plutonius]|uniref:HK97-gp10 family putative phage morphogenesis protein n=1 Tax=Melissococcus plutonius TaxID=33970 RepID=UPI0021E5D02F|nr:HK97-gp10 family putative phage morphogenesis protein [Melissococcus plutonius]MCV2499570.1 HK97 gp10 family phage protein [Melissococcus plutonius]MCV2501860.1 HK97 gp10 family phage protein [Melissococcus plutonius]MCV2505940.1 HK97 gp10 family phage protein [Melissococcus plutonius]MCV2508182.1 HK97 gp10 family phage protein [Melissococcus plutonius]MCV2528042.1 HK97 gp10 family phage protein [Melissococcus plutonius]
MSRRRASLNGTDVLIGKLKRNATLKDVKQIVKINTAEMTTNMQRKAPVDTGFLRRSIILKFTKGGFTGIAGPTAEYGPYLEFGTRYMSAQPYVKPAFIYQKKQFMIDLRKLVD